MSADRLILVVLAAVIERNGLILVTRRQAGPHRAGLWEFPGGKCGPDETHEACLARELAEEIGVRSTIGPEILVTEHTYPERTVRLHFRWCSIDDEPRSMLGQEIRWLARAELPTLEFPEADVKLIAALTASST